MDNTNTNIDLKKLEELFVSKKYDEARDFLVTKKSELSPGLFHYNMGTVLGEQGNLPAARYHFEIAKKEGFGHPALYKNLSLVSKKISVNSDVLDQKEYVYNFFSSTPSSLFLFTSLILTIISIFTVKYFELSKKIIVGLILLFFTPTIYKEVYFDKNYSTAINLKEVELFQGPSKVYEVIDMIPAGNRLILSKSHDSWVFIEYPIEFSGWIDRKKIAYY